jgi:hypothetical protein
MAAAKKKTAGRAKKLDLTKFTKTGEKKLRGLPKQIFVTLDMHGLTGVHKKFKDAVGNKAEGEQVVGPFYLATQYKHV